MNPFEAARRAAHDVRDQLEDQGFNLSVPGPALWKKVCDDKNLLVERVSANHPALKGTDATINISDGWLMVRDDVSEATCAFLVAHELGHLFLHPKEPGTFEVSASSLTGEDETQGAREVETYGAREREELQANVFAREFLLPKALARSLFLEGLLNLSAISERWCVPQELVRLQLYDGLLLPDLPPSATASRLPATPTPAQQPAVASDAGVTLVEAGPGTGKSTALLLRLRRLIEAGVDAHTIVVITFSNKAARELVERAKAAGIPNADRVWIGTFHAFGLEFLRKFGELAGLKARFPVLDKLAALALLEADLPSLDLEAFDVLSNPSPWLEEVVNTIRRSKDEVVDAESFRAAVERAPSPDPDIQAARFDVATIFRRYELLLSQRRAVDLADLLCQSIRLLSSQDPGIDAFLANIHHVMVDEYQDVNRASARLVKHLCRSAQTLWIVADANQAIYGFMGASAANLRSLNSDFRGAVRIPLAENHRSSQEIVDTFCAVAARGSGSGPLLDMKARRGQSGHLPQVVTAPDLTQEIAALCRRIRELEQSGISLSEQAVIGYRNIYLAALAKGLEEAGIPVLFLGNIFDRPEIKDLLCLLQLAVDPYGANLLRSWHEPLLRVSPAGVDRILSTVRESGAPWTEVAVSGLDPTDLAAITRLRHLCRQIARDDSPWDALAKVLLEDGLLLRAAAQDSAQASLNARMAIWQFVHFCRSPDGTGRWSTVKNLSQRIRDRIRLGEDRSLRLVPPEAEGLNAVRIVTAHGSKGLEFDAVHFVEVTKRIFEPSSDEENKWLPDGIIAGDITTHEALRAERHHLLYVVVSRPRSYLTVYTRDPLTLPAALHGLLEPRRQASVSPPQTLIRSGSISGPDALVELDEYLRFIQCPQQYEFGSRAVRTPREALKLYRALDLAVRSAMETLTSDPQHLSGKGWQNVMDHELERFGLHQEAAGKAIRARAMSLLDNGRQFIEQGGELGRALRMRMGSLSVEFRSDQAFESADKLHLRLFRLKESSVPRLKQPLAALLDAHHAAGGIPARIEIATLENARITSVGKVFPQTRERYLRLATQFCEARFPPAPIEIRNCHYCGHLFSCVGPEPRIK